ncbi:unnamed protein product [Owenia fusiformis]|uniref:Uncharacterized protein n=1 Tax=Owenia fusiformis TaxID=6347 RepID=A0A8J1TW03_OWEFU|nr:unnamed protein product [Owenia fusiformis]
MALKGIKVIELAGLAPAPYCGLILSDFGANVIRVDKTKTADNIDKLCRGKRSIAIDLKNQSGVNTLKRLCGSADVLIEPFRKGVMEKLGLGPRELLSDNPRLIYARLTGYGQSGVLSERAGHDINYLAISGVLSRLGRKDGNPHPPVNLLADFAGGGLTCALGIAMALFERSNSGKGQVIDANMVEGAAYIGSFLWAMKDSFVFGKGRGENFLDGGAHFYDTYKTKDSKFMAVGAIEPQFYEKLVKGLGLDPDEAFQMNNFDEMRDKFSKIFATKTRDEWSAIFDDTDACVTPILEMDEAANHPHNTSRNYFKVDKDGAHFPGPAPSLSRTPATVKTTHQPSVGEHTLEVLMEAGFKSEEVEQLATQGAIEQCKPESKL